MVNLYDMLKKDEGEKLKMYKDTEGYYTIGVGHLITKNPSEEVALEILHKEIGRETKGEKKGVIEPEESEKLFQKDISETIKSIENNSTLNDLNKDLDSNRKMALENMVFQLGATGVSNFKKSIKLLKEKNWPEAAKELADSKWHKQTPNRSNRVISVFETGTLGAEDLEDENEVYSEDLENENSILNSEDDNDDDDDDDDEPEEVESFIWT